MSRGAATAAIAVAVVLAGAYWPAVHGAFLWDDVAHLPTPELRTAAGLWRILFVPGTSQQYYPLLFGTFWLEHWMWGDATFGYHVVNVVLHGVAAGLVWTVLRRLAVPGALFAAGIFALHPVHVESVAWIAELKNTLSGVFYLASMLAYLSFDDGPVAHRPATRWLAALALFVGAMLSKSVTGSLPAAILVVLWWKRGRLSWSRDVVPLLPFFLVSAGLGWFTARYEADVVGASGASFDLSFASRCLIAGRAFWFYLAKLVWPVPVIFIYPRWHIDPMVWWQWAYPVAALALLVALALLRGVLGRGPLAAALFFVGTLFPALGFVNVYPFKFSFVADHFQYLASLGPIVLVSAALTRAARGGRRLGVVLGIAVVAVLAVLSWRQSRSYQSPETLWRATVEHNPTSFLAQIGLGVIYEDQGKHQEAIEAEEQALAIDPGSAEARLNLARSYDAVGDYAKAARFYEEGLRLESGYAGAVRPRLALLYARLGEFDRAVVMARAALALTPNSSYAYAVLGIALKGQGDGAKADQAWQVAIRLDPEGPGGKLAREQLAQPAP
jgi:tetratricopeptide (TPR) repeat protein